MNTPTLEKDNTKTQIKSQESNLSKKIVASGGTQTHDLKCSRLKLYQLTAQLAEFKSPTKVNIQGKASVSIQGSNFSLKGCCLGI